MGITSPTQSGREHFFPPKICVTWIPFSHLEDGFLSETIISLTLCMKWDHTTRYPIATNELGKSILLMETFHYALYSFLVTPRPSCQHSSQVVRWVGSLHSNITLLAKVGRWKKKLDVADIETKENLGLCKSLMPGLFCFVSPYTAGPPQWNLSLIEWLALVAAWDK